MREITLMRDASLSLIAMGGDAISRNSPSIRKTHAVRVLVGFKMQVGGPHAERIHQHLVQETNDWGVFNFSPLAELARQSTASVGFRVQTRSHRR